MKVELCGGRWDGEVLDTSDPKSVFVASGGELPDRLGVLLAVELRSVLQQYDADYALHTAPRPPAHIYRCGGRVLDGVAFYHYVGVGPCP